MNFLGKVEIVSAHDREIRTVREAYPVPAVARLLHQARPRPLHVRFCRKNVYLRDDFRCQYCRKEFAPRDLTLDHVVPRTQGGPTEWGNVVSACARCNRRKGGRTPEQAGMDLLKRPIKPRWLAPKALVMWYGEVPDAWRDYLH